MKICCKKFIASCIFFLLVIMTVAQDSVRVFPTHWFTGMKNRNLQLLFYSSNKLLAVDKLAARTNTPAIKIKKLNTVNNRHYLLLDVEIAASAKPGTYTISFGGII